MEQRQTDSLTHHGVLEHTEAHFAHRIIAAYLYMKPIYM